MDDPSAFVRARLDEDEQVAREATPGPWQVKPAADSAYATASALVMRIGVEQGAPWSSNWVSPWIVMPDSADSEGIDPADAEHIARWDPARVLAEVEAKRRVLDLHAPVHGYDLNGPVCSTCGEEGQPGEETAVVRWPCPTVRLLAAPFASHPDYREEWRPVSSG